MSDLHIQTKRGELKAVIDSTKYGVPSVDIPHPAEAAVEYLRRFNEVQGRNPDMEPDQVGEYVLTTWAREIDRMGGQRAG